MTTRALRTAAALVVLSCAALAGCVDRRAQADAGVAGATPIRGGTLEIVGLSDVDHLATTSAYVTYSLWLSRLYARQLLGYEAGPDLALGTRPLPDLAAEVPTVANGGISADGLSYVFHLRPGVRWSSQPPREVTAQDVVRAFALFCNPVMPVGAAGYYTDTLVGMKRYCDEFARVPGTVEAIREFVTTHAIEGVSALDDTTVLFRLVAPTPDFLNLVAMPFASPVPVEYLDYLPDGPEFRQHTLSNGPYRLARYLQNRELVFERNPEWDPATDSLRSAYVDRVRVRLGIDAQLQQLQIEAGTADFGNETLRSADLGPLLEIDDPTLSLTPPGEHSALMNFLAVNRIGPNNGGALDRLEVRRAIALAVDRAALVQVSGGPRVTRPLTQAVLSSATGFDPGAEAPMADDHGDPAAARAMLAEAGFPNGITLRLAFQNSSQYPLMAQVLQGSLARAGIEVVLVQLTTSDFYARLLADASNARRGEWDMSVSGWLPDWYGLNGRSVISPLFDGRQVGNNTQNYGHYQNPEVDAAIDRATVAPSPELAEQEWRTAARLLLEDVALVPLTEQKLPYGKSRRVRNCLWSVLGLNCDLTSVWLADAESG